MDFDLDYISAVDANELLTPSQSLPMDSVKWQSSQIPCPVLKSLMSKGNLPRQDKGLGLWQSSGPVSSASLQQSTNASASGTGGTRPLSRTNSRPRFGRYSEPDTRSPLQTPDLNIFNASDSSRFLDLVKTVAERVDENAGFRAAKREDLTGVKRKARTTSSLGGADASVRVRRSRLGATAKAEARVSRIKGVHREDSVAEELEHEGTSSDSFIHGVPGLLSSSFASTSSSSLQSLQSSSTNVQMQMDVEVVDTSMSMSTNVVTDTNALDRSTTACPYPITLPRRRPPSRTTSMSSGSASDHIPPDTRVTTTVKTNTLTPKLHPLLSQQNSQRHPPASSPRPAPQASRVHPPPQRIQRPPATQTSATTRLPALGMRRTPSAIPTSHPTDPPLPTRQKAFKPPLQSQQQPRPQAHAHKHSSQSQSSHPVVNALEKQVQPIKKVGDTFHLDGRSDRKPAPKQQLPSSMDVRSTEAEAESNPDADSSFGDISFDMDALEETMRMYD